MAALPINDIVNVIVNLSPRSAVRSGFNVALIIGSSAVIPTDKRVRIYSSAASMLDDGFTSTMPEYQAALIYFAANSNPRRLAIGYWDEDNESLADAVTACRLANGDWYICIPLAPTESDILAVAKYIEGCTPSSMLFYTTSETTTLATLQGLNYNRTLGIYSEREPLTSNLAVALAGWAMGANTGLANSAYTLAYKTLAGVLVDPLNENTVNAVKAVNGNYYINRGAQYNLFEPGVMASGVWFDEIINLDMLSNDVQLSVMDLLNSALKIPGTESGVLMIITAITAALDRMMTIGFIAPGIWMAPPILNLNTGDAIPGYLVQSESIDEQSQANRDQRISPPIYVALKLSGAIQYVTIRIDVNR